MLLFLQEMVTNKEYSQKTRSDNFEGANFSDSLMKERGIEILGVKEKNFIFSLESNLNQVKFHLKTSLTNPRMSKTAG